MAALICSVGLVTFLDASLCSRYRPCVFPTAWCDRCTSASCIRRQMASGGGDACVSTILWFCARPPCIDEEPQKLCKGVGSLKAHVVQILSTLVVLKTHYAHVLNCISKVPHGCCVGAGVWVAQRTKACEGWKSLRARRLKIPCSPEFSSKRVGTTRVRTTCLI